MVGADRATFSHHLSPVVAALDLASLLVGVWQVRRMATRYQQATTVG
jgi:cytochrome oxidase assembly protein ShyY1